MNEECLMDSVERLKQARAKLAFLYDSLSQSDHFEFSTFGGDFGLTLILEHIVEELMAIEGEISSCFGGK